MYEIIPKKTNNLAANLSLVLTIGGVAAMYFSTLPNLPFRTLMQTISVVIIATGLMLLGRYVFKSYSYAIIENSENGGYDLTVTEIKKRSRITLARVAISGIEEILLIENDKKSLLKEKKKGRKSFNYCVDLCPKNSYLIICRECGEELAIRISCDQKLIDLLYELGGDRTV